MISHLCTHAKNNHNLEEDHNFLSIPQNMVTTTHSQNYKILCNIIEKGDVQRTPSKVRIV